MNPLVILLSSGVCTAGGALGATVAAALTERCAPAGDGPAPGRPRITVLAMAGALLGAAHALHGTAPGAMVTVALAALVLAGCSFADLRCGIVPDAFTLIPLACIVLPAALHGHLAPLLGAAVAALPFAAASSLSHGRGMGWGDVKLTALAGALLGAYTATMALALACVLAAALAMLVRRGGRPIAFAPYLAAAIACGTLGGTLV